MDMFCGRVYKPNRILYYFTPTEEQKRDYYQGIMPECFAPYDGAFGTYDYPGMFITIDGDKKTEVLGMEFRPNDDRVSYPENMESVMLPGGFMVLARFAELEQMLNLDLSDGISLAKRCMEIMAQHDSLVFPKENPGLIQIFTLYNQPKIFIEAEQYKDSDFFSMIEPETENEKKLFNAAYRDWITGHYNWNYILPFIIGYGLNGIQDFAFAHFDVKDFKAINVVYGHETANGLLKQIAGQLNKMDWIYYSARCDNDNFCMMIKDMPEDEMRQKLFDFFEEISTLPDDPRYRVYYRCGVVPMRHTLMFCDTVADAGKETQRLGDKKNETEVLFYSGSAHDVLDWSARTKVYLDTAIQQDEFLVYLQPKYDIKSEKLYGAEALIRWNYRGKALLSPSRFVPIFEMGGLISKLDDFVLKKVCTYLKRWENEGRQLYPISVNLSRKSLGKENFVEHLTKIVDSYEVEHKWIEFELTESAANEDQAYMLQVMQGLKKAGFKISMDDFGTGYSSLSLLSLMPMDTIKIDKSFVDHITLMHGENKECEVLKHIISMVKDLKLTCLAEGVEEKEQLDILSEIGCELVQGYYYSKPLPVEEYEKRL